MESRAHKDYLKEPVSIYEVHLGSWLRGPHNSFLSYRELADKLVDYAKDLGYTHLELLPRDGASVLRIVGLSDHRLLRAHRALRPRRRISCISSIAAIRRASGVIVDWVPAHFPERCARPGVFRWHRALRACRSAQGRASRLGHADLQLRPQRSAHVPDFERAVLAEGVSHRRPARGRGGVHAVPGLFAQAGRMDSEHVRRQRKPGSDRLSAALQRTGAPGARRDHHCRRIHRVCRRIAARLS